MLIVIQIVGFALIAAVTVVAVGWVVVAALISCFFRSRNLARDLAIAAAVGALLLAWIE